MRNITAPYNVTATSAWRSPVTFLLGGVALMIAMIAFACIILACSYVRHPFGSNSEENEISEQSEESGAMYGYRIDTMKKITPSDRSEGAHREVVVIMAGDVTPTFIANPTCVSAI